MEANRTSRSQTGRYADRVTIADLVRLRKAYNVMRNALEKIVQYPETVDARWLKYIASVALKEKDE
jgi:hypothetical protein